MDSYDQVSPAQQVFYVTLVHLHLTDIPHSRVFAGVPQGEKEGSLILFSEKKIL
jgi:hypothetical protein